MATTNTETRRQLAEAADSDGDLISLHLDTKWGTELRIHGFNTLIRVFDVTETSQREEVEKLITGLQTALAAGLAAQVKQAAEDAAGNEPAVIWVASHVERIAEATDYVSIDRFEWDAMTVQERDTFLVDAATETMNQGGGCGASVVDAEEVPEILQLIDAAATHAAPNDRSS